MSRGGGGGGGGGASLFWRFVSSYVWFVTDFREVSGGWITTDALFVYLYNKMYPHWGGNFIRASVLR